MKKVLLVEDNFVLLKAIETYLTGLDFEVIPRQSTKDLPEELPQLQPDLAILDVWVEPTQGDALSRMIKTNGQDQSIPVILISAKDDLDSTARNAMADAHLHKPFRLPELGDKVLSLLE